MQHIEVEPFRDPLGPLARKLNALSDELCVFAHDREAQDDVRDEPLIRLTRAIAQELRMIAKITQERGTTNEAAATYIGELIRRAHAILSTAPSIPPPSSRRSISGTRPRVLAAIDYDDDPPTSPSSPASIAAKATQDERGGSLHAE